jgi:hypothetical protein
MKTTRRLMAAALAVTAFAVLAHPTTARPPSVTTTTTSAPTTRTATADERAFCEATIELFGPITGDCAVVPLWGSIEEDDPWGRWDCARQGNHICDTPDGLVIYFNIGGQLEGFYLDAPDRPGCFMEPSNTPDGWEVIFYSRISGRGAPEFIGDPLGFEVRCQL